MTKTIHAMMAFLLIGIGTTNICSMKKQDTMEDEEQARATYKAYVQEQDYIKSAEKKISKAIRDKDAGALKKELQSFIKELHTPGKDDINHFLVNFLNEAIYAQDLTAVKMIVSSFSTRNAPHILNPESNEGPQGRFNPLWHAELNSKNGTQEARDIYNYLLKKSKEFAENTTVAKLEKMNLND